MAGALSALCHGWDRPGPSPSPAVTENGCYVTYALKRSKFMNNSGSNVVDLLWQPSAMDRAQPAART